jgi:hypothetical protein
MKISPTALSINQLFGSANEQYVIPTYQRRYSWQRRQVWELIDDIRLIEDGDTHLLGNIVCLTSHLKAGINGLELVDGQQRLTTMSILMECLRERLLDEGKTDSAGQLGRLLSAQALDGTPKRKIALDSIDSAEFNRLVEKDLGESFQNQQLLEAFTDIRTWIAQQPLDKLHAFIYRLTNQATVIRLDVSEARDAFKLFETINNRGLHLSPTDIIKNFLLGNAARFGEEALQAARESWASLIRYLDGTNSDTFFRYYLMTVFHTRIMTWEVVPHFKRAFMEQVSEAKLLPDRHLYADADPQESDEEDAIANDGVNASSEELPTRQIKQKLISFKDFLIQLMKSADAYGQLVLIKTGDKTIDRHLRHLRMIKAVQTYGFLTRLRVGGCTDKNFRSVLKLTESFVLRRHICRERSNETEALFAKMCEINPLDPVLAVREAYRGLCPSDDKFQEEFANASFTSNVIERARYCLERIEENSHSHHDEIAVRGSDEVHVEHIIPQKINSKKKTKEPFEDWVSYLGEKAELAHPKQVSRIGNLTLFSGELNIVASNNPFLSKKQAYKKSGILLTQELLKFPSFKFKQVEQRSRDLAKVAVGIWPAP